MEKFGALHKREEVPPLPDTTATICFSRSVVNLNFDMFYQSDDQHKDFKKTLRKRKINLTNTNNKSKKKDKDRSNYMDKHSGKDKD